MSASHVKALAASDGVPVEERIFPAAPEPPTEDQTQLECCERHLDAVIESLLFLAEKLEQKDQPERAGIVRHKGVPQAQALRALVTALREEGQERT